MASDEEKVVPAPVVVTYDPITGVPSEFNEFLPKDCEEYKRWKAAQAGEAAPPPVEGQLGSLKLADAAAPAAESEVEKKLPGGKCMILLASVKKKVRPEVIVEKNTRNKKKCVTTVLGLDTFGIRLADASKLLGKKFASGASITKSPTEKDQIDVQGDFVDKMPDFLIKTYGKDKGITKKDIFIIVDKKKSPAYDGDDDS